MSNRLPLKDRLKDHPLMGAEECDRCHEPVGPKDCLYELGKDYVCGACIESHFDELEARIDARREER